MVITDHAVGLLLICKQRQEIVLAGAISKKKSEVLTSPMSDPMIRCGKSPAWRG